LEEYQVSFVKEKCYFSNSYPTSTAFFKKKIIIKKKSTIGDVGSMRRKTDPMIG
jgi:hypothetical protein